MTQSANNWYYAKSGTTIGPISFEQIKDLALRGDILAEDVVLNELAKRWIAASTVPGIAFRPNNSTPPVTARSQEMASQELPTSWERIPPAPTAPSPQPAGEVRVQYIDWSRLKEIARWHRWLNATVIVLILSWIANIFGVPNTGWFTPVVWLGWLPLMFKSARSQGVNPWAFVVAGCIPIVNLIAVMTLVLDASRILRRAGFRVGLLGAWLPETEPANWAAKSNVQVPAAKPSTK